MLTSTYSCKLQSCIQAVLYIRLRGLQNNCRSHCVNQSESGKRTNYL